MRPDSAVQMSFDVPVLLITWRRPETTRQVIDAMRAVAPSRVFVASDGPRTADEAQKVIATRELIAKSIDWPCEIKTRYSEANQGCERGVSSAINWFFEYNNEGIILEDDCVPQKDFFYYCQDLLNRYRGDSRIWSISGNNFQNGISRGNASYYFSKYVHVWGWACWRDRWKLYEQNHLIWETICNSQSLQKSICADQDQLNYWSEIWQRLYDVGLPDTWDYRWSLVSMANNGLVATPNKNLVLNVGFDSDATHTTSPIAQGDLAEQFLPIIHPSIILADLDADRFTFMNHYDGLQFIRSKSAVLQLTNRFRYLFLNPFYYPRKIFKMLLQSHAS